MTNTQVSLSWDAYQKNICKGLSFLQEKGEFVDMTLAADGHYVKVHRMILSLVSPFIKELISATDCPHPVLFLNNVSYPTLCSILEYIYTGEVMVNKENLSELVKTGKALQIKGLDVMLSNIDSTDIIAGDNDVTILEDIYNESTTNRCSDMGNIQTIDYDDTNVDTHNLDDSNEPMDLEINQKLPKKVKEPPASIKKLPVQGAPQIQYTLSNQGGLQMILNRYVYNMRYMSKHSNRRHWRCIQYPRKIKCPAYVTTNNEKVIERGCSHNHPFHDKLILKKIDRGITYSAIQDAELLVDIKKKGRAADDDIRIESD